MKTNRFLFAIATIGIVALSLNSCKEETTPWNEEVVVTTGECVEMSSATITIAGNKIDFAGHEHESLDYGVVFVIDDNSSTEEIKRKIENGAYGCHVKTGAKIQVCYEIEHTVYVQGDNIDNGAFSVTIIGVPHDCMVSFASYCLDIDDFSRKPIVGEVKQVNMPKLVLNCNFKSEMLYGSCSYASILCEVLTEIKESEEYEFFIRKSAVSNANLFSGSEYSISDYDYWLKPDKVDYYIVNNHVILQDTIRNMDFDTDYYINIYAARKKSPYTIQVGKSEEFILHSPKFNPSVEAYSVSQNGIELTLTGYFMAAEPDLEKSDFYYFLSSGGKLLNKGEFNVDNVLNNSGFDSVTVPLYKGLDLMFEVLLNRRNVVICDTLYFETDSIGSISNVRKQRSKS